MPLIDFELVCRHPASRRHLMFLIYIALLTDIHLIVSFYSLDI